MLLFSLPYELMFYVVGHLSLDDVQNLSLTSRRLQYLVQEPRITKSILEVRVKELTRRRRWDEARNGNNPLRWSLRSTPASSPPSKPGLLSGSTSQLTHDVA